MELVNALRADTCTQRSLVEGLIVMLAPFAPHFAEESWERLGHATIGVRRALARVERGAGGGGPGRGGDPGGREDAVEGDRCRGMRSRETVVAAAQRDAAVRRFTEGKEVRKVVYVPNRLLNLLLDNADVIPSGSEGSAASLCVLADAHVAGRTPMQDPRLTLGMTFYLMPLSRSLLVLAGPAAFVLSILLAPSGLDPAGARVLGLALWMAIWWVSEVVPLAATSLLPIVVLPLFGIRTARQAAETYGNELVYLFLAGFIIAAALERWHSHARIAYGLVAAIGTSARRVVLGVMVATAFVSLWISNTATAAMMFPITVAIGELFDRSESGHLTRMALFLGMAYAASIGGMGTLIGTPPNLVVAGAIKEITGTPIDFGRFMLLGLPITLVLLPLTWALLVFVIFRGGASWVRLLTS